MACDRCGKVGAVLEEVTSFYQTPDVHHICGDCRTKANTYLRGLRDVTNKWTTKKMQRFMGGERSTILSRIRAALNAQPFI